MPAPFRFAAVAAFAVALAACSSAKPKFQEDQLLSNGPNQFSRSFPYSSADACESSRRALLSQGYMTTMTHGDTVDANKNFQPTVDQHIVVEVHVVCTAGDATNSSMVYVNAIQNGYALKKSDTSASVGLSILGSVSLPIRSNSDEMVKISSETIQSGSFYTRFFELVGRYLSTVARSEPVPNVGKITIAPLPPPLAPSTAASAEPAAPTVGSAAPAAAVAAAATGAAALHGVATPATPMVTAQPAPNATANAAAALTGVAPAALPQQPTAAPASVSTNVQGANAASSAIATGAASAPGESNVPTNAGGASAAPATASPASATAP